MNKNLASLIKTTSVVLLGLIIVGYSLFQASTLLRGPVIDIYTPQNNATYDTTLIQIQGRARNIAYIRLNGTKMFTDKDGYFDEKILLSPGYNVVTLIASDKFGKHTEKKLELILKEY
jgi:hypothetical protein